MKVNVELIGGGLEYPLIDLTKNEEAETVFAISNVITDSFQQVKNIGFHTEDASFIYSEMTPEYDLRFKYSVEGEMICEFFMLEGSIVEEALDGTHRLECKAGTHNIVYWKQWHGINSYKKGAHVKSVTIYLKKSFFLKCVGKENNLLNDGFANLKDGENWTFGQSWGIINQELKDIIHEIISTQRQGIYLKLFLESKLKELLLLQIESLSGELTTPPEKPSSTQKLAETIYKIIKENTFGEFTLKEISQKLGSNVSTISTAFKQHYNITIFQYWNSLRFNEAKNMLSNNYSVKEISIIMGYKNANHFSSAFKKHFSITPTEFVNSQTYK